MDRQLLAHMYPQRIGPYNAQPVPAKKTPETNGDSFQKILDSKFVKLSHHAQTRLEQRGIELQPAQWEKLTGAVEKAARKGAKDSLILMQDLAFIVNVKQRTIVTAMDESAMKDHVFTQIDSTIVLK